MILNTGKFPLSWTEGIIIPIHKKGDKSDPSNHRGITLLSNFAKLFTCVLNQRITTWSKINDVWLCMHVCIGGLNAAFGFKSASATAKEKEKSGGSATKPSKKP